MSILWFLIIGALAGWIAGELTKGDGFGLLGNIVVGVIGALIGGYVFSAIGIRTYGLIGDLIMSIIGALILLFIVSLFRRAKA
jgi:uncharacterized membrane protein YeaQ/YmgE (transglycosylase-associated protein family)